MIKRTMRQAKARDRRLRVRSAMLELERRTGIVNGRVLRAMLARQK